MATTELKYCAFFTQWKTVGMLVEIGRADHIVTNIDVLLDSVHIQSVVRKSNGEVSRVVGSGCVRISIPSNKGKFQCELNIVFRCIPDSSSNLPSVSRCTEWGHHFTFGKKSCVKLQRKLG